jgi:hypothetical protein
LLDATFFAQVQNVERQNIEIQIAGFTKFPELNPVVRGYHLTPAVGTLHTPVG